MSRSNMYEEWNLDEIKKELKNRNAKVSGRKKDLVARLRFLDANHPDTETAVKTEFIWFCQRSPLRGDLPNITISRLEEYLRQFEKEVDSKIKLFYNERFLRFIRLSLVDAPLVYVASCVWAEMRKAASYQVDLSLDMNGVVQEAQCECGAGQGPNAHSKHMCTVLYALACFCQTGDIITELTCTQVLQTFHKVKAHKGSPIKVEELQGIRGTVTKPLRPVCIKVQHSMAVMQFFPPANIPAVCHDHDYLELTPEEEYLKCNKVIWLI